MAERLFVLDTEMTQLADKIREKTNSTDPLSFPQGFINAIDNAGGGDLNFEVVRSTTQPSNPKENTIWVNTNVNIPKYVISATQPSSPESGLLWIKAGNVDSTVMNAVKDNILNVYLGSVSQYTGSSWIGVTAKIYQSGSWKDLSNILYVLKDGKIATQAGSFVAVGSTSFSGGKIVSTSHNLASGNNAYFSQKVNVDKYKTLRFHINPTDYYVDGLLGVGLMSRAVNGSASTDSEINSLVAGKRLYSTGSQWVNIDISGITGSYYISVISVCKFTLDEIYLTDEVIS